MRPHHPLWHFGRGGGGCCVCRGMVGVLRGMVGGRGHGAPPHPHRRAARGPHRKACRGHPEGLATSTGGGGQHHGQGTGGCCPPVGSPSSPPSALPQALCKGHLLISPLFSGLRGNMHQGTSRRAIGPPPLGHPWHAPMFMIVVRQEWAGGRGWVGGRGWCEAGHFGRHGGSLVGVCGA